MLSYNEVTDYVNPLGQPEEEPPETNDTEGEKAEKENDGEANNGDKKEKNSSAKEFFEWIELFGYAVAVVIVLFTFLCRIAVVNGPSMEKTLYDKDVLLVSDLFYEPKQGDIIVFQSNTILDNEAIVKRVIATEGQVVDIDFATWTVTVDGVPLEEDYVNYIQNVYMYGSNYTFPLTVEEGKIFVMGDNRNHSTDSRDSRIGQVDTRFVLGRVLVRILPLQKIGPVD